MQRGRMGTVAISNRLLKYGFTIKDEKAPGPHKQIESFVVVIG